MMMVCEHVDWPGLRDIAAGWSFGLQVVAPDGLADALQAALQTQESVILVLPVARVQLALWLAAQPSAGEALAAWSRSVSALLAVFRQNRRRILMIDPMALTTPEGAAVLQERFGLSPDPSVPAYDGPGAEVMDLVFAGALLDSDAAAKRLADDLSSGMLSGSAGVPATGDIAACFAAGRRLNAELGTLRVQAAQAVLDAAVGAQQLAGLEKEHALLGERDGVQSKTIQRLESASQEAAQTVPALNKQVAELRAGQAALIAERDHQAQALSTELAERHIARALSDVLGRRLQNAGAGQRQREAVLGAQILAGSQSIVHAQEAERRLQAECDGLRATLTDAERQCRDLQGQLGAAGAERDRMRAELDHIYQSRSWRAAGMLRNVRYKLGPAPSADRRKDG